MSVKDSITTQTCKVSKEEFKDFLTLYPIPSEYHVILPKSNQTVFDAPPRYFIYIEDDEDLLFLPKEPSPGFGTGYQSVLVNTESLKDNKEPMIQPVEVTANSGESPKPKLFVVHPGSVAARIKVRKFKSRGGSSRPLVKRKLA
ncbi:hypothetical protein Tco_1396863, partial [Tanacetum coccineum]